MNTEAIHSQESILNTYLGGVLAMITDIFFDPYIRFRPSKQNDVKNFRKMMKYLRKVGRDRIVERIAAFKNNEHLPDDILSSILSSYSKKKNRLIKTSRSWYFLR